MRPLLQPSCARQVFSFLYTGLTLPEQVVSGAAARAMRRLCQDAGAQLGEPVLALYDQVQTFPRGHLKRQDELALLEVFHRAPSFAALCACCLRQLASAASFYRRRRRRCCCYRCCCRRCQQGCVHE